MLISDDIDVRKLNHLFDNTTAAYKYLWFLSLLDIIDSGRWNRNISFIEMVARMLGNAWPLCIERGISFGKFDMIFKRIWYLTSVSPINKNDLADRIRCWMVSNPKNDDVLFVVKSLTQHVPYRFLYPWIGSATNAQTAAMSRDFEKYGCMYSINNDSIHIYKEWAKSIQNLSGTLYDATWMRLNKFLSKKNKGIRLAMDLEKKDVVGAAYSLRSLEQFVSSGLVAETIHSRPQSVHNTYINYNAPVYNQGGTMNGNVKNNHPKQ